MELIAFKSIISCFLFQPLLAAPFLLGFLHPFIFNPQQIFKQKELNLTHQGSNPMTLLKPNHS